jgi:O-antigen/teichoic acid export membrane protein
VATIVCNHAQERRSLSADLVLNVGSQFLVRIVTAVSALYAARVLGPAQFGVWAVLQVLFMYTAQGHCGAVNAMMREVPLAQARNDNATAQRLVNNTWGLVTLSSVLVAALSTAGLWWMRARGVERWGVIVAASALLVLVQMQSVFFQFYCRAYATFKLLAFFSTAQALITLPLCFWWIPRWGIAGYLFALSVGFSVIAVAVITRPGIRLEFSWPEWASLLRIGLPMLPGTLMLYLNMSIERIVLASGVSAIATGIFAAGAFFFQIGGTLWELVIYTWYSRLAALYGETGEEKSLVRVLREVIPGALWLSSLLQGALFLVLPFGLRLLLPEYLHSIVVAQILVLAVNLWGIAQFLSFSLTIIGRQKQSALLQGTFLVLKLCLLVFVAAIFQDVMAVAVASVVALLIYAVGALLWWKRVAGQSVIPLWQSVVLWGGPAVAALVCQGSSSATGTETAFRVVAYFGLAASASFLMARRSRAFRRLYAWSAAR